MFDFTYTQLQDTLMFLVNGSVCDRATRSGGGAEPSRNTVEAGHRASEWKLYCGTAEMRPSVVGSAADAERRRRSRAAEERLRGAAGACGRRARRPALHGDARVVGVGLAPRRLVQDGLGQLVERAVDVDVGLRRRLQEPDAVLARYLRARSTTGSSISVNDEHWKVQIFEELYNLRQQSLRDI